MVIDQSRRLHMGIANGGTDKFEAALEEVFAHGIALGRFRGKLTHR